MDQHRDAVMRHPSAPRALHRRMLLALVEAPPAIASPADRAASIDASAVRPALLLGVTLSLALWAGIAALARTMF